MSRYQDVTARIKAISDLPSRTPEQLKELGNLIEEAGAIRAENALLGKAQEEVAHATRGQGTPALVAAGARPGDAWKAKPLGEAGGFLEGNTEAGEADVKWSTERDRRTGAQIRSVLVNDDGDMLLAPETIRTLRSPEYKAAFRQYLRFGLNAAPSALRVIQEGSDQEGGFLVPEDILTRVISRMPTPTRVAGRVTRLTTSRDSLMMPRLVYNGTDNNIYSTGIKVTWTGEIPASATAHLATDPVWGQFRVPIQTAMLSLPLTRDIIEDAVFPIVDYVSGKISETVDILYDDKIINGTGQGQPFGILSNPGATDNPAIVTTGDANLLTPDGIKKLTMSLPEQYDGNAVALFNKTSTALGLSLLKDADNRYLWGAGLQDSGLSPGWKDRQLVGYDCVLSGLMPDVAANSYPIIFGDLTGYYLVNRLGFSIQVLNEILAQTNQVLLLGRLRIGGGIAEAWKLKVQKVATP